MYIYNMCSCIYVYMYVYIYIYVCVYHTPVLYVGYLSSESLIKCDWQLVPE